MEITERQEKLLDFLIKEYIGQAKPVSSKALKKACALDVCGATIRNDLQILTKQGYIEQPHTSAGRIPTKKAYKHIADKLGKTATFYDVHEVNVVRMSIVRQVRFAHEEMEREMRQMEELMQTLENDNMFEILTILETWHKKIMN
jgi:transcriptional regulator of heat shock response